MIVVIVGVSDERTYGVTDHLHQWFKNQEDADDWVTETRARLGHFSAFFEEADRRTWQCPLCKAAQKSMVEI